MFNKIFYTLSSSLLIISIIAIIIFGLPLGLDFKGGSLMEIKFLPNSDGQIRVLNREDVESIFKDLGIQNINFQKSGSDSLILRFENVEEAIHQNILKSLGEKSEFAVQEQRFDSIGSVLGKETIKKSVEAIVIVLFAIVIYVAWAFRKLSFPIKSWRYGIVALVTLFHDVLITIGFFAVYLHFSGGEIGVSFIAAILTILGYSVNDTIVVFDRLRENLLKFGARFSFKETVFKSIKETLTRSTNASLTTIFVLLAIFFFGGSTTRDFVLALIVGIFIGTYSSIAVAAPLLETWTNWNKRRSG